MPNPKLLYSGKTTHLAAYQGEATVAELAMRARAQMTACGRALTRWMSGEHVHGDFTNRSLCGNCARTETFRDAALQAFRNDHAAEIAQAEAYVRTKFFPPLPVEYGELAVRAVALVNAGDPYALLDVSGLNPEPRGAVGHYDARKVTAARLVEVLRLGHMIDDDASDLAYLEV